MNSVSKSFMLVAVSIVGTIAVCALAKHQSAGRKSGKTDTAEKPTTKVRHSDDQDLDDKFLISANKVRREGVALRIHKLQLYGLFKQATCGRCTMDSPSSVNIIEKAKYDAWNQLGNMPTTIAKVLYIDLSTQILAGDGSPDSLQNNQRRDKSDDSDGFFMQAFGGAKPSTLRHADDVDGSNDDEHSIDQLHAAAAAGDLPTLQRLLEDGKNDPNSADSSGQTPLHLAADKGNIECVSLLLRSGADPNSADSDGTSVLQVAVIGEDVATCKLLMERGADPDQADADGETARSWAKDAGAGEMIELFSQ